MKPSILRDTIFENITDSNGQFTNHFHDTYTIGITHNGMFKSIHEHKASLAYPLSARIITPGEVHCGDSHAWQYTNFYPSVTLLSDLYEQMYGERKMPIFHTHIIQDIMLYEKLVAFFKSVYDHEETMCSESKLIHALSYLIAHYTDNTAPSPLKYDDKKNFSIVVEYIHEHLEGEISLQELSRIAQLSKYHFLRLFKNHTGLTPHQYIMAERIYRAKKLILKGESLSLAGLHAGFSDQSHFIRSFRKIYGYSPKTLLQESNFILYK